MTKARNINVFIISKRLKVDTHNASLNEIYGNKATETLLELEYKEGYREGQVKKIFSDITPTLD